MNVPENHDLEKLLQESSHNPEKTSPNPELKTPPLPLTDLGQPRKSPLTGTDKKYPLMRQRGFYSDILSPGTLDQLGDVCCGPYLSQNLIHQADFDKFTPKAESFVIPEDFQERVEQQSIGTTTWLLTQTDFPLQSYEPKVQVPFHVLPGHCPRKIEIERCLIMKSLTAGLPQSGSTWAWSQAHNTGSPSPEKPFFPQTTPWGMRPGTP